MYYSAISVLAFLVLCIENHDILLKRESSADIPARDAYRGFLFSVLVYYVFDALWGVLAYYKLRDALFLDTQIYFLAMAIGILYWTRYTVVYLDEKSAFGKLLLYFGNVVFAGLILLVAVNFFTPVLFRLDEQAVYRALPVRYVLLGVQILLLLLISGYAFSVMARRRGVATRRFRTIAFFGLIMAVFLSAQLWLPKLPLYALAYMTGTCLLHAFVVGDEKEAYKEKLEEAYAREKCQHEALVNARILAYKDALTGVKSKLACVEEEGKLDQQIREGTAPDFAVAIFDLNALKEINDRNGHEAGDQAIIEVCRAVCGQFQHSPVFRIGGDEFVAFLTGEDYENRRALQESFTRQMTEAAAEGRASAAMGISDYRRGVDETVNDVFLRADKQLYANKNKERSSVSAEASPSPTEI